jgi:hypothetical protein
MVVRYGTDQYQRAEQDVDELFRRRMPGIDR